jgi:hypothetical protein
MIERAKHVKAHGPKTAEDEEDWDMTRMGPGEGGFGVIYGPGGLEDLAQGFNPAP